MTQFRAAEWIRSQVLPPDRAASAVGDWMEDSSERGDIWFWSCVLRTVIAGLWSDIANNPLATAGLGILAFARSIIIPISVYINYPALKSGTQMTVAIFAIGALWYCSGLWIYRRFDGRALVSFVVSLIGLAFVAQHPWIHAAAERNFAFDLPGNGYIDLLLLGLAIVKRHSQNHPTRMA